MYISRFKMVSIQHSRPLLAFPVVKILDLLFAGAIVEVLSSCCSIIGLIIALAAFGVDTTPLDPVQAAFALGAAMLLGLAFGGINSLLMMAMPLWMTVNSLFNVFLYMTSRIFFVPSSLPVKLRYYFSLQSIASDDRVDALLISRRLWNGTPRARSRQ